MMAAKKPADDWFEALDRELERKTEEVVRDAGEQNVARAEVNRQVIDDFWRIWKRFHKINVHFSMEPSYEAWAVFADTYPEGAWTWRPGFAPGGVGAVQLVDRTSDQGRVGDALKVVHYAADEKPRIKVTFEYCEGEHYYKYSGWKRIWSVHTLLDAALDRSELNEMHKLFADVVKVWYESHLRRNRDLLIKHLKKEYPRVETFNQ